MLNLFLAEIYKLRRMPAFWLALSLPALHAFLGFVEIVDRQRVSGMAAWLQQVSAFWAGLVMPFGIAMICGAVAGLEHQNLSWRYLLTIPRSRPAIYLSKYLAVVLTVGLATMVHIVCSLVAAKALSVWRHEMVTTPMTSLAAVHLRVACLVFLASLAQVSLVWWLSMRVQSPMAPVFVAMAGIAVLIPFTNNRILTLSSPWQFAMGIAANDAAHPANTILLISVTVALAALIAGTTDFTRWRQPP